MSEWVVWESMKHFHEILQDMIEENLVMNNVNQNVKLL